MPKKSIQMTFSSTFLKHTPSNIIDNHMGAGGTTLAESETHLRDGGLETKTFWLFPLFCLFSPLSVEDSFC
jgi:hypothetical protein